MAKQRPSYRICKILLILIGSYLLYIFVIINHADGQFSASSISNKYITDKDTNDTNDHMFNVSISNTNDHIFNVSISNNDINISSLVSSMLSNLTVLKYNSVYRVGNLLYGWGPRWNYDIMKIKYNMRNQWNDTILYRYFNLADMEIVRWTRNKFDVKLLKQLINEYIIDCNMSSELPSNDELVVHIRAGDVIRYTNFVRLIKKTMSKYPNIEKITFVTALHFGHDVVKHRHRYIYTESQEMENRKHLRNIFTKIIKLFPYLSYKLISNENIDKDMVYLSKAKYFIRDEGTFDHVITELNDNIIINKFNDTIFFS